jgi:hypothetical protein
MDFFADSLSRIILLFGSWHYITGSSKTGLNLRMLLKSDGAIAVLLKEDGVP